MRNSLFFMLVSVMGLVVAEASTKKIFWGNMYEVRVFKSGNYYTFNAPCEIDYTGGEFFSELAYVDQSVAGVYSFDATAIDTTRINQELSCSGFNVQSSETIITPVEVDAKITAAKADFRDHVDSIPSKILTTGAVIEMKNNLQQQLSQELTSEINSKVEELVQQRLEILVPQKVSEEVIKQLQERGL